MTRKVMTTARKEVIKHELDKAWADWDAHQDCLPKEGPAFWHAQDIKAKLAEAIELMS